MPWSSELNRHFIGAAAVAAAILGVAVWGGSWGDQGGRRAALLENSAHMTQGGIERQASRDFGAVNEGRSTVRESQPNGQQAAPMMPQPPNASKTGALGTAASAWKNWSNEDWQIAIQAVDEHRSAATGSPETKSQGVESQAGRSVSEPLEWKAPEEISGQGARR